MARRTASGLPDALERRTLFYGQPKRPVDRLELGRRYLDADRLSDALECFEKAPDEAARRDAIGTLRKQAIREGNHFLLNRIHGSLPLSEQEWHEAAERAKAEGKLRYALKLAKRAGAGAAALVASLERDLGIARPPEVSEEGEESSDGEEAQPEAASEDASQGEGEGT